MVILTIPLKCMVWLKKCTVIVLTGGNDSVGHCETENEYYKHFENGWV